MYKTQQCASKSDKLCPWLSRRPWFSSALCVGSTRLGPVVLKGGLHAGTCSEVSCSGIDDSQSPRIHAPERIHTRKLDLSRNSRHAVFLGFPVLWAWSPELLILLGLGRVNPEEKPVLGDRVTPEHTAVLCGSSPGTHSESCNCINHCLSLCSTSELKWPLLLHQQGLLQLLWQGPATAVCRIGTANGASPHTSPCRPFCDRVLSRDEQQVSLCGRDLCQLRP